MRCGDQGKELLVSLIAPTAFEAFFFDLVALLPWRYFKIDGYRLEGLLVSAAP